MVASTTNVTPILFLLSAGADPAGMLLKFAHDVQCDTALAQLSLGVGQVAVFVLLYS